MKRSDVLKIIETAIDNACGNDGENRLYPPNEYLSFCILKDLENVGMLPPEIKDTVDFDGKKIICYHNAWESENEEK